MSASFGDSVGLPPEEKTIRVRCVHPTGTFTEFTEDEIEQSIASRFEQQVTRHPHRLAVVNGDSSLTYDNLNRQANRVAQAILAQRGEGQEPVALLFDHSALGIAAILGVLKAGKMFVPIDPSFPSTRIAYMLGDSQAGLIVTNEQNFSLADELAQGVHQIINIDGIAENRHLPRTPAYLFHRITLPIYSIAPDQRVSQREAFMTIGTYSMTS